MIATFDAEKVQPFRTDVPTNRRIREALTGETGHGSLIQHVKRHLQGSDTYRAGSSLNHDVVVLVSKDNVRPKEKFKMGQSGNVRYSTYWKNEKEGYGESILVRVNPDNNTAFSWGHKTWKFSPKDGWQVTKHEVRSLMNDGRAFLETPGGIKSELFPDWLGADVRIGPPTILS